MRILLAGDIASSHLRKWANELVKAGAEIGIFSLSDSDRSEYAAGIRFYSAGLPSGLAQKEEASLEKLKYLLHSKKLRKAVKEFSPDILHSHYLTSYGLLGVLSGFRPFVVSVWGTDIFEFPKRSALHKSLIKYILKKADKVLSTSRYMADEVRKYYAGSIGITPFGTDLTRFRPAERQRGDEVRIGLVKKLEPVYGIELFIEALSELTLKGVSGFKAEITGDGYLREKLQALVKERGLTGIVSFNGFVDNSVIEKVHQNYSFEVYPSVKESFGVSAVEAMACGVPVIVSSDTGLTEVAEDNISGLVFRNGSVSELSAAIEKLITDEELRSRLAAGARKRAEEYFDSGSCTEKMISYYREVLKS